MKKNYGIDLDGTVFDFKTPLGLYIEDKYGVPFRPEDIVSYYWHECIDGLSEEEFWDAFHEFGRDGAYRNLEPIPGAIDGINAIIDGGHSVRFITNRPIYAYTDTLESLLEHGLCRKTFLHFAEGSKAPLINKCSIDIFIDDSPYTIADLVANTRADVYCVNHSYNKELDDNNGKWFQRISSWEEFLILTGVYDGKAAQ